MSRLKFISRCATVLNNLGMETTVMTGDNLILGNSVGLGPLSVATTSGRTVAVTTHNYAGQTHPLSIHKQTHM